MKNWALNPAAAKLAAYHASLRPEGTSCTCSNCRAGEPPVKAYDPPPEHYRCGGLQPWDVVDAFGLDFYRGNVLKYLLRAGRKDNELDDLVKARNYLNKVIEMVEDK